MSCCCCLGTLGIISVILLVLAAIVKVAFKLIKKRCTCKTRLDGKTVVITGCTAGIGKETAFDLARRGARVVMGCRDLKKSQEIIAEIKAQTGNQNVLVHKLHLESFKSIQEFSEIIHKTESRLDILINNAGASTLGNQKSENGLDLLMQTNHFGPFLLTNLLLDLIKKSAPSRIVNVSSIMHHLARLDTNDLNKSYLIMNDTVKYANSKMCNILMSNFLAKKLKDLGVTSNSVNPGPVFTDIHRSTTGIKKFIVNLLFSIIAKNANDGAQTTIHVAVSEDLANVTGKYFSECRIRKTHPRATDEQLSEKVWMLSEKFVHLQLKILHTTLKRNITSLYL